jgi:hypothetical protein
MMKKQVGIWADHRKAVIVTLTDAGDVTSLIVSQTEKHLRRIGDSPMKGRFEAKRVPADDLRQNSLTAHLNAYYDAVTAAVCDAQGILIFGPGEAKSELKKRLVRNKLGGRIRAVETADKMTDRQIAAKVHAFFAT